MNRSAYAVNSGARSTENREEPQLPPCIARSQRRLFRAACWLKECRRLGTRFEKLAVNFLAMADLSFIERYLRVAFANCT